MSESLDAYRSRTGFMWDSLPDRGGLQTHPSLTQKVDNFGQLKPFFGDTVLFSLPRPMTNWLARIQDSLYRACGFILAQPLAADTFHITLHDLASDPDAMPAGADSRRCSVQPIIDRAREAYPGGLRIRACCPFSMVNTSIVMGFEPAQEQDCQALTSLYEQLQRVVPLSYPLTLHATLAYYRPGQWDDSILHLLRQTLQSFHWDRPEWTLDPGALHYALFDSMAHYFDSSEPHLSEYRIQ